MAGTFLEPWNCNCHNVSGKTRMEKHGEILYPWVSKMRPVKILIRLRESNLNLCWARISEGTFSDVAAHVF